jgi:anti-sigma regulatory factor (Ser/Thr protein kinase)
MMGTSRDLAATLALLPTPGAAASARACVRAFCRTNRLAETSDVASLVVSELVSNALRHAHTPMVLALRSCDGVLRMEVADQSPRFVDLPENDLLREGGRGLAIVASLSSRWGVEVASGGKTVWAELAV